MALPENLRYTPTHEWVRVEGETAVVGITDYAVEQLSDLVFVDLPEKETEVDKDSRFGEIESTKTVSDLISPVSGTITDVNSAIENNLDLIKDSPYEKGWMLRIRMSSPEEVMTLLTAADYQKQIDAEGH
jgi:glycine cleavage system H protein